MHGHKILEPFTDAHTEGMKMTMKYKQKIKIHITNEKNMQM